MKSGRPTETKTIAADHDDAWVTVAFLGIENPRHSRVIQLLLTGPMPHEHLDALTGCSNVPELIADPPRRGLEVPCTRTRKKDRDLFDCWPGFYHCTQADRREPAEWKGKHAEVAA